MGSTGGRDGGESLRGLTGAGPSKVGVDKAMRARDVSRPRDEEDSDRSDPTQPDGTRPGEPKAQSVGGSGSAGSSPDSS
jgi:hypothetical protein